MANFRPQGTLSPYGAPVLRNKIITNSVVMVVMNSVKLASGFIALGTTGALVYGHTIAIVTNQDVGLTTTGAAGAALGSFVGTYTVTSTNQTVAFVKAKIDISKETLYSAPADNTLGSTTGSNLAGYNMDLADSTQLSESSATANTSAATTAGQYTSEGLDAIDSTRVIVHIYESQVFGI